MKRVTLNGIKRRGLVNWRAREWWLRKEVRIWSAEHAVWWRPSCCGYTVKDEEAGIFNFAEARSASCFTMLAGRYDRYAGQTMSRIERSNEKYQRPTQGEIAMDDECLCCDGTGDCPECDGTGLEGGKLGADGCPACGGSGACPDCGGSGHADD